MISLTVMKRDLLVHQLVHPYKNTKGCSTTSSQVPGGPVVRSLHMAQVERAKAKCKVAL